VKFEKFSSDDSRTFAVLSILGAVAVELSSNGRRAVEAGFEPDPAIEFELLDPELKQQFCWVTKNVHDNVELGALIFIASARAAEYLFQQGCLKNDMIPEELSPMIEQMLRHACIRAKKSMLGADGTNTA
jgi:hypothetical protein